jgi:regulatory protein
MSTKEPKHNIFNFVPYMDANALYLKIANYCAYQERSLKEVETKLKAWEVPEELHEQLIQLLFEEGFLSQERFANTYTRGKINLKKWGKTKVKMYLKHKGIDDETIQNSLGQVDEQAYLENAQKLAKHKLNTIKDQENPLVVKQKIYRFLLSKGFEMDVIQKATDWALKGGD